MHAAINVVSFGFMEAEHWSDSYSVYSLFDNRQGLRQCTACHEFYLQNDAPYIGHLTSEQASRLVEPPPAYIPPLLRQRGGSEFSNGNRGNDYPNAGQSWIQRIREWWSSTPSYRAPEEGKKAGGDYQIPKYPRLKSASHEDLVGILENQEKYSVNLIQAARILYWLDLNNVYRNTAKTMSEKGQIPYPTFKPTAIQIDNMKTLLALLEFVDSGSRKIAIAELYRELGEFERTIDLLQKIAKPCLKSETILEAARKRISAPIPILYSYQGKK